MTAREYQIPTTAPARERAVLVGLSLGSRERARTEEYLEELALLADSAGAAVVASLVQERPRRDPAFLIGKGKAEELAWLVMERDLQLAIFDDDLSPVQLRNLERLINRKVLDRSGLILDIFASRARTREARTQVELAQLQYLLPRLTRQWTHLSKQYGGIGTKGPGETQIETDRRAIRTRISHLSAQLKRIGKEREIQRKGRQNFPRVALVGYTNAGKSTLLNWFTNAGVPVEDRLFATLDSTVRMVTLSPAHRILLSDTVGFIRKLPHHLVASFRSTLDEVREADILVHVVDASHPLMEEQIAIVNETLEELGAGGKQTIMVFNKIDRVANRSALSQLRKTFDQPVFISATRGINMTGLVARLTNVLDAGIAEATVCLAQRDYALISRIHDMTEVVETSYDHDAVTVRFRGPAAAVDRIRKLIQRTRKTEEGP